MSDWNRRDLLKGTLALAGLPPCCTTPDIARSAVTIDDRAVRIELKRSPELGMDGGSARVVDEARKINLIVVRVGRNRYAALDRKCTHGSGPLAYKPKHRTVQCTCWGRSEFALDGRVIGGPAKRTLRTYPVTLAGGTLEIRLEGAS